MLCGKATDHCALTETEGAWTNDGDTSAGDTDGARAAFCETEEEAPICVPEKVCGEWTAPKKT